MKIMHLLQSPHFSGAENVVCQIIAMMKDQPGMEAFYCSCDGPIRNALEERNIRFSPISDVSIKEVKRVIREEKPDIIHAHDRTASLLAAICCGNIPFISHIHYNAANTRSLSLKAIGYLVAAKKAKHIFWVSQSSFDGYIFHRLLRKKSTVLYNIIDIDSLYQKMRLDSREYTYDIIFIGRIVEQKDPLRLLEVFKLVKKENKNVRFAIIGTGEMSDIVQAKAGQLKLTENISFLGFQSNPLKMLHDSKVMLMTSKYEGTPMCALESLALGVPIVSTPADGMKVLIQEGKTGFLAEDNESLAEALNKIIESPVLREKLSTNAINFSKEFNDVQKYRDVILRAYRS